MQWRGEEELPFRETGDCQFFSNFICVYMYNINVFYHISVSSSALYQRGKLQWPCGSTWSRPFPRAQCVAWHSLYSYLFILFYSHYQLFSLCQWSLWAAKSTRPKMALMLSWKNMEEVTTLPQTVSGPSSSLTFKESTSEKHWIGELNTQ